MLLPWLRRLVSRPAAHARPRTKTRWKPYCPWLEPLETRVVPAHNLSLSPTAALNVGIDVQTNGTTTTYTAVQDDAVLRWADVAGQLVGGQNVVIDSGSTGSQAGNITDQFVGL